MPPIEVWIPGRMPGENEIIKAAKRSGKRTSNNYTKMKRSWTDYVAMIFKGCNLKPVDEIFVHIEWVEPNRMRDKDNISAAKKFIFDGMVAAGFIKDDGWKQIIGWREDFSVNPRSCGVLLKILTGGNGKDLAK